MNNIRKKIIFIFIFSFLLRWLWFYTFISSHPHRVLLKPDCISYERSAYNLATHRVYSISKIPPFKPFAWRPPGYPLFLASIYLIFGRRPLICIFVQLILSSISCVLCFKLSERLLKNSGLIAGILLAIDPIFIAYTSLLLSEILFIFLILLVLLLLTKPSFKMKNIIWSGLLFGYSILVRPIALSLYPIFIYLIFKITSSFKKIMVFLSLSALFLLSWVFRNYLIFNSFRIGGAGKWFVGVYLEFKEKHKNFLYEYLKGVYYTLLYTPFTPKGPAEIFLDFKSPAGTRILNILKKSRFKNFIVKELDIPFKLYLIIIYSLSLLGFFNIYRFRKKREFAVSYLYLSFIFILVTAIFGTPRYRLPSWPFLSILSAQGVIFLKDILYKSKGRFYES